MTNVTFFKCTDDPRVVNKNLTPVKSLNCNIYGENTRQNPRIKIRYDGDIMTANYMYIEAFNRYYSYEVNTLPDGSIELVGACDYFVSYKNDMRNSTAHIVRSLRGSKYISDPMTSTTERVGYQFRNLGTCFAPAVSYIIVKGS